MVGTLQNITERKRVEEERARLAAIVESSDDAIISKTLDGTITTWNKGAERIYGYAAEEVVGRSISLLIPPHYEDDLQQILGRIKRGEHVERYETVRRRKDGRLIDVSITVSPIKESSGRIAGASVVARDITERRRVEEELKKSERLLAQAQQLAHLGSWEWDIAANKTRWSDELYRIYGLQPQEFGATFESFLERVHPEDQEFVKQRLKSDLANAGPYSLDYRIIRPDGAVRVLYV